MSLDDLGSAAWADTSPSASPKLDDDDIWGSTKVTDSRIPDLSPGGFGEEDFGQLGQHDDQQQKDEPESGSNINKQGEEQIEVQQKDEQVVSQPEPELQTEVGVLDTPGAVENAQGTTVTPVAQDEGFGDDDGDFDFDDTAAPVAGADEFGDFDDFGDFDEGAPVESNGFGNTADDANIGFGSSGQDPSAGFVSEPHEIEDHIWEDPDRPAPPKPLRLDPRNLPSKIELREQIDSLLAPMFPILSTNPPFDKRTVLTDEPVRQVEGLAQILSLEESRDLYAQLITPPILKSLDWKRSRVRREQLISLGIPVNLDEVDSHRLSALPPLRIGSNAEAGPGPGTSTTRDRNGRHVKVKTEKHVGPRPEFNRDRCGKLLSYREDQLGLVPPKYLSRMQEDLVQACSEAANLLAWLKQINETRGEENRRRNETIAGLIASAQKYKASEMTSGGLFRKGSTKRSGSGSQTPKRISSPAMGR